MAYDGHCSVMDVSQIAKECPSGEVLIFSSDELELAMTKCAPKFPELCEFAKHDSTYQYVCIVISAILDCNRKEPLIWLSNGQFNDIESDVKKWIRKQKAFAYRDLITNHEISKGFEAPIVIEIESEDPCNCAVTRCKGMYIGVSAK